MRERRQGRTSEKSSHFVVAHYLVCFLQPLAGVDRTGFLMAMQRVDDVRYLVTPSIVIGS